MYESVSADERPFPLSMAAEGEQVKIVLHQGGRGVGKRLTSLGLNINSEIEVIHRQGDSLILGRSDMRFALGAGVAQKIMVVRKA